MVLGSQPRKCSILDRDQQAKAVNAAHSVTVLSHLNRLTFRLILLEQPEPHSMKSAVSEHTCASLQEAYAAAIGRRDGLLGNRRDPADLPVAPAAAAGET